MNNSYSAGSFGSANNIDGMWQKFDEFRSSFGKSAGTRAGRGEVRTAVLALLFEKPMHGYQIINEIDQRSGGSWKPSAGSVYPTLQLLADEGLVSAEEANGRKVYSLTEEGREVAASSDLTAAWTQNGSPESARFGALPKSGVDLAQAAAQVSRTGSPEQVQQAVAVLDDARRRLYSILAQD